MSATLKNTQNSPMKQELLNSPILQVKELRHKKLLLVLALQLVNSTARIQISKLAPESMLSNYTVVTLLQEHIIEESHLSGGD